MDEKGKSRWSRRSWSSSSNIRAKMAAAAKRNAAGMLIINPPGAADPRATELIQVGSGGRSQASFPVLTLSSAAGEKLLRAADPRGRSLLELRHIADEGGGCIELEGEATIQAEVKRTPLMAANVGSLLPGRGELAEQIIVVGAHLDHIGMGYFGSRWGSGKLHPGADDNASGSAGILMLAEKLHKAYEKLPEKTPARTLLFIGFSGEESGLNGSRYYVDHPIAPLNKHVLMTNFDMIGRISNNRLSISGNDSATGFAEWLQPFFDQSPLQIVTSRRMSGGSDHASFYRRGVPILFGIIADFHADYHTPSDVSWKINRVAAVETIHLFERILFAAATRPKSFPFSAATPRRVGPAGARGGNLLAGRRLAIRFGILRSASRSGGRGVVIRALKAGSAAAAQGLRSEDLLVSIRGEKITNTRWLYAFISKCKPGEKIAVGIERKGKAMTLELIPIGSGDTSGG